MGNKITPKPYKRPGMGRLQDYHTRTVGGRGAERYRAQKQQRAARTADGQAIQNYRQQNIIAGLFGGLMALGLGLIAFLRSGDGKQG